MSDPSVLAKSRLNSSIIRACSVARQSFLNVCMVTLTVTDELQFFIFTFCRAEMLRVSELEFLQQQKEVIEERISRLQGAQSEEPRVHTAKKPLPAATLEVDRKMGVITQDVTVRKHGLPTTNGTSKKSQEQKSGTTGRQKPNGGSETPHNNIVETEHSSVTSESGSGSGSGSAPSASIFGRVTNLFSHGPNQADE